VRVLYLTCCISEVRFIAGKIDLVCLETFLLFTAGLGEFVASDTHLDSPVVEVG